jgi:CRP/FNR family cyclic AMP-dependent transcriptional regulator
LIPAERRAHAILHCTTREVDIPVIGDAPAAARVDDGGIGLLMLEGLLIRRVGIDGRFGAELLGEGDLLRPWHRENDTTMLPLQTEWSMIMPARVAVLDAEFVRCLSSYPEIAAALVDRAMKRSRNLAINMAIVHQSRVDTRLHMLFWHLAGRWGRVRPDATVLPVRLTHAVLAELVAARRQTVTTALSDMGRRDLLEWTGDVWLLYGEQPVELLEAEERLPQPSVS